MSIELRTPRTGTWRLVPSRSTATFRMRHLFGLASVEGAISVTSGVVTAVDGEATVRAALDPATFHTGNPKRDKDVRSRRFLDVDQYPTMAFSGAIRDGEVVGTLTVHGTEVATVLTVDDVTESAERVEVRASTTVDRVQFGVSGARGLVGRHLAITLSIVLVPE